MDLYGLTMTTEDVEQQAPVELTASQVVADEAAAVEVAELEMQVEATYGTLDRAEKQIEMVEEFAQADDAAIAAGDATTAVASMSVMASAAMAKQLGFPEDAVLHVTQEDATQDPMAALEIAAKDKRGYIRKAIDLIRKGFVKLNAMVRKAYVKVLGTISGISSKADALAGDLKGKKKKLTWENMTIDGDDAKKQLNHFAGMIALANGEITSLTTMAAVGIARNEYDGVYSLKDINDIGEANKIVLSGIKSDALKIPGDMKIKDIDGKKASMQFVGASGKSVTVMVIKNTSDSKDKPAIKVSLLDLEAADINEDKADYGTLSEAENLAKVVKKAAGKFSKVTDKAFKGIKEVEKAFEEVAKKYSDDPSKETKILYASLSSTYKAQPKLAFKIAMNYYKSIKTGLTVLADAIDKADR